MKKLLFLFALILLQLSMLALRGSAQNIPANKVLTDTITSRKTHVVAIKDTLQLCKKRATTSDTAALIYRGKIFYGLISAFHVALADSATSAVFTDSSAVAGEAWHLQTLDSNEVFSHSAANPNCVNARRDTITGCNTDWVRIQDSLSAKVVDCDSAYRIDGNRVLYQSTGMGSVYIGYSTGTLDTSYDNTAL